MEIRGGGEIILWPGTGDFQVDSNKSSSHSLEPIIGKGAAIPHIHCCSIRMVLFSTFCVYFRRSKTQTEPSDALAPTLSPRAFQHTSNMPPVPR